MMCGSVPQMAIALTLQSNSNGPGRGTGTSSTEKRCGSWTTSARMLDHGHRVDHGARRAAYPQGQRHEQELPRAGAGEPLQVEALHDVDPALDQEQGVHWLW